MPTPIRQHYSFVGWFKNEDLSGDAVSSPYTVGKNITLYAKWQVNKYTVSFNSKSGSSVAPITVDYGQYVTLPTPTRDYHTFMGWFEREDFSGNSVSPAYAIEKNVKLYAKWEINKYIISFNANGGSPVSPIAVDHGQYAYLPTPTKAYHNFIGWFENEDFSGSSVSLQYITGKDVKLYAKWVIKNYTISFDVNGGGSVAPIKVDYGQYATLPTTTKAQHTFMGWFEREDFSGSAVGLSYTTGKNITLYAKWVANRCTVTFVTNGGNAVAPITIDGGQSVILSTPTREHYSFAGWFENENLSGGSVSSPYTIEKNVTLYAKWVIKNYTISFDVNGGSLVAPIKVDYGQYATLPTTTKAHYTFMGWFEREDFSGSTVGLSYTTGKNITLYAKWVANQYTVRFVTNGGNTVAPITLDGVQSVILSTPTREHYSFAGWFENGNLSGGSVSSPYTIEKNVTLYAAWEINKFTVNFNANGGSTVAPIIIDSGQSVVLSDPNKDGRIFAGWFENEDLSGNALVSPYVPRRDITLYAKWITEEEKYFEFVPNKEGEITVSYGVEFKSLPENGEINIPAVYNGLPVINIIGFRSCKATIINIPNSIISIGGNAFRSCTYLKAIIIPESVASIGYSAFYNCDELITVTFVDNSKLTTLGNNAFWQCDKLTTVTFGRNSRLQNIGNSTFHSCRSLVEIVIPDSVTSIGNSTFALCESLKRIVIPKNIKSIGANAFIICRMLETVTFSEGSTIDVIADGAFSGCTNLTSIVISTSVTNIGDSAFSSCKNLTSIVIPASVTSIESSTFYGCSSLGSVTILGIVTSIGSYAFNGCTSLTSIAIPGSLTIIENYTFSGCVNLTSIVIPDSVTSIGGSAFSGCSSLTEVVIPISVTDIGTFAFGGCAMLTINIERGANMNNWSGFWNIDKRPIVWVN